MFIMCRLLLFIQPHRKIFNFLIQNVSRIFKLSIRAILFLLFFNKLKVMNLATTVPPAFWMPNHFDSLDNMMSPESMSPESNTPVYQQVRNAFTEHSSDNRLFQRDITNTVNDQVSVEKQPFQVCMNTKNHEKDTNVEFLCKFIASIL